jgi:TonB family protein
MKNQILIIVLLIFTSFAFAQNESEMIYYKGNYKPADTLTAIRALKIDKVKDSIVDITYYNKDKKQNWQPFLLKRFYSFNDTLIRIDTRDLEGKTVTHYRKFIKDSLGYKYIEESEKGVILEKGITERKIPLFKQGKITSYYANGELSSIALYKDNVFISNKNWNRDGSEYLANIPPLVDKEPKIIGGANHVIRKHIMRTFNYPKAAKELEISGRVLVKFILMEDMSIAGVHVSRKNYALLDEEAKRIVSLLKFEGSPAMSEGKNVKRVFTIPINFRIVD